MSLTFTSVNAQTREPRHDGQLDGKTGRHPEARLDRPPGRELHPVLADWPRPSHLPEMEWTHVLLSSLRSLVRTRRPRSPPRGARRMAFLEAPSWLEPRKRQCRLRRISRGD